MYHVNAKIRFQLGKLLQKLVSGKQKSRFGALEMLNSYICLEFSHGFSASFSCLRFLSTFIGQISKFFFMHVL